MALTISDICILFARKGGRAYDGEPVTQLEHALQTAARAEDAGAPSGARHRGACCTTSATCSTTRAKRRRCAASTTCTSTPRCRSCATCSTTTCWRRSSCTSTPSATCARRAPGISRRCRSTRSAASALQGGVFTPAEAAAFIAQPYAADAVRRPVVGRPGKVAAAATPPLAHFVPILEAAQRAVRPRRVTGRARRLDRTVPRWNSRSASRSPSSAPDCCTRRGTRCSSRPAAATRCSTRRPSSPAPPCARCVALPFVPLPLRRVVAVRAGVGLHPLRATT